MSARTANLAGIVALCFWSMNVAVTRIIGEANHYGMPGLSFTLAGLIVIALDFFRGVPPWRARASWRYWILCGAAFAVYMVFYVTGLAWSPERSLVLPLALINYLWPSCILLFMPFFFRCRLNLPILVAGIALCFGGIALALLRDLPSGNILDLIRENGPAFLMMLACALLWGFYSVASRKWGGNANGIGCFFLATGLCLLALWRLTGGDLGFTRQMILPFLFHALAANALAYLLWEAAIRRGDLGLMGSLANFLPLTSTLCAAWSLGDSPPGGLWLGCAMVTAGAALCRKGVRENAPETPLASRAPDPLPGHDAVS